MVAFSLMIDQPPETVFGSASGLESAGTYRIDLKRDFTVSIFSLPLLEVFSVLPAMKNPGLGELGQLLWRQPSEMPNREDMHYQ